MIPEGRRDVRWARGSRYDGRPGQFGRMSYARALSLAPIGLWGAGADDEWYGGGLTRPDGVTPAP